MALLTPRKLRRSLALSLAVTAALVLSACGSSGSTSSSSSGSGAGSASSSGKPDGGGANMSIGFLATAGIAPVSLGESGGYFKKYNVNVSNVNMASPADGIADLVSGKTQMAVANTGSLASALQQGLPLVPVSSLYYFSAAKQGDQGIYTTPGSGITRPRDLENKTVAVGALKNNFDAYVLQAVKNDGGDPSKVHFTLVTVPNIPSVVINGTVAAGQVAEPYLTQNLSKLSPVIANPSLVLKHTPVVVGYLVTTKSYLASHRPQVEAFKAGFNAAVEKLSSDPATARQTIASFAPISPDTLAKMILPTWSTDMGEQSAIDTLNLMVSVGYLDKAPDLKAWFASGA